MHTGSSWTDLPSVKAFIPCIQVSDSATYCPSYLPYQCNFSSLFYLLLILRFCSTEKNKINNNSVCCCQSYLNYSTFSFEWLRHVYGEICIITYHFNLWSRFSQYWFWTILQDSNHFSSFIVILSSWNFASLYSISRRAFWGKYFLVSSFRGRYNITNLMLDPDISGP